MPKKEVPLQDLAGFLPEDCLEEVIHYLEYYRVHLTVKRSRASVLGDYRNAHNGRSHRISVNGNLNAYAFLITLLHELAHLLTFEKYGHRVQPHGGEWKSAFSDLLIRFVEKKVFPADVEQALFKTIRNPSASSCSDAALHRVLRQYDKKRPGACLVEDIPANAIFQIRGGREFRKGEKMRSRYK